MAIAAADEIETNGGLAITFKKLLIANRGEIADRVRVAAATLGIKTVGIHTAEDINSPHIEMVDTAVLLTPTPGSDKSLYLDIDQIINIAKKQGVDAIHPGYGFLSESPEFAEACEKAGIKLVGPSSAAMKALGSKTNGRNAAVAVGIPVAEGSKKGVTFVKGREKSQETWLLKEAERIGYPIMVKAVAGGGGRGMRLARNKGELIGQARVASTEASQSFSSSEIYLEKYIEQPRHLEMQVMADAHGNVSIVGERDCTLQFNSQKLVEETPQEAHFPQAERAELKPKIIEMFRKAGYTGAATVEFLRDQVTGKLGFGEINARIQVEHPVTEVEHAVDLVRAQILVAMGHKLAEIHPKFLMDSSETSGGHAIEVRITARDPANGFKATTGTITSLREPHGDHVRVELGVKVGMEIKAIYDPLIAKIIVRAQNRKEANERLLIALKEFHVDGIQTDATFLRHVVANDAFRAGKVHTKFIENNLQSLQPAPDDIQRLMNLIAYQTVNRDPALPLRPRRDRTTINVIPPYPKVTPPNRKLMDAFEQGGPEAYVKHLLKRSRQGKIWVMLTDWRDAFQSKYATQHGASDMAPSAPFYVEIGDEEKAQETFGGAADQSAILYRKQQAFKRHWLLHQLTPNVVKQMLFRSNNITVFRGFDDKIVDFYVQQARAVGVTVFRNFCPFNNIENMLPAAKAILKHGGVWEAAICYKSGATPEYYAEMAVALAKKGAHTIAIKDMAGEATLEIEQIFKAMRSTLKEAGYKDFFLSFHTHDTGKGSIATCLAALRGGANCLDAASDSISGGTSQPSLGTLIQLLPDIGITPEIAQKISDYYQRYVIGALHQFRDLAAEAVGARVFKLGQPGGQASNLRKQARGAGVQEKNLDLVDEKYEMIRNWLNRMILVTPTSKGTGDLAIQLVLYMQKNNCLDNFTIPDMIKAMRREGQGKFTLPEDFVKFIRGDMGLPRPEDRRFLAKKQDYVINGKTESLSIYDIVLDKEKPYTLPTGKRFRKEGKETDIDKERADMNKFLGYEGEDWDLACWLVHNTYFKEMIEFNRQYGKLHDRIPSDIFFNGMQEGELLIMRGLDGLAGKEGRLFTTSDEKYDMGIAGDSAYITLKEITAADEDGVRKVIFDMNGKQFTRSVVDTRVAEKNKALRSITANPHDFIDEDAARGTLIEWYVKPGTYVEEGQLLYVVDIMKSQQHKEAPRAGIFHPHPDFMPDDELKVGKIIPPKSPICRIEPGKPPAKAVKPGGPVSGGRGKKAAAVHAPSM